MTVLGSLDERLRDKERRWLITGVAGFIGSHLLETLLSAGQFVRGLDNFATGHKANLDAVRQNVGEARWANFELIEGDVRDERCCQTVMSGVDYVLHQAALGSVPRSLVDPLTTTSANITGFLNVLEHARRQKVLRFVYAASSSTYGDSVGLPKVEEHVGNPISPYAVTKRVNEIYADVYARCFGMSAIGLRYFNVFGPRQDPGGPYAAVIPRWLAAMTTGERIYINGDGETSRDFCFVQNVVQANLAAALSSYAKQAEVYNIAIGQQTTLLALFELLRRALARHGIAYDHEPIMKPERVGDVRHSLASIEKASIALGYRPTHDIVAGIECLVGQHVCDRRIDNDVRELVLQ